MEQRGSVEQSVDGRAAGAISGPGRTGATHRCAVDAGVLEWRQLMGSRCTGKSID